MEGKRVFGVIRSFQGLLLSELVRNGEFSLDAIGLASGVNFLLERGLNDSFCPIIMQPSVVLRDEVNPQLLIDRRFQRAPEAVQGGIVNSNPGFITRTLRLIRTNISRGLSFVWHYKFEFTVAGLIGAARWGLAHRAEANNLRRIIKSQEIVLNEQVADGRRMHNMDFRVKGQPEVTNFRILASVRRHD